MHIFKITDANEHQDGSLHVIILNWITIARKVNGKYQNFPLHSTIFLKRLAKIWGKLIMAKLTAYRWVMDKNSSSDNKWYSVMSFMETKYAMINIQSSFYKSS